MGLLLTCALNGRADDGQQGKVYFLRSTNYVGSLVKFKMSIDGELVCKLKNQYYSVHSVPVGEHNFQVQNSGLTSKKLSRPLKITVSADKPVYLSVVNASPLYLEELTPASGERQIKSLLQTKDCLGKDKK